jgi:hypothetical protein
MQLHSRHRSLGRAQPALPERGCQRLWSTAHRRPLQSHISCWQQRSRLRCRAAGEVESQERAEDRKIKTTLADLDAILGIQEEEPAAAAQVRPRAAVPQLRGHGEAPGAPGAPLGGRRLWHPLPSAPGQLPERARAAEPPPDPAGISPSAPDPRRLPSRLPPRRPARRRRPARPRMRSTAPCRRSCRRWRPTTPTRPTS